MSPGLGPRVSQSQKQGLGIGPRQRPSRGRGQGQGLVRECEGERSTERATEALFNKGRIWLLDSDPYGTYSSCSCSLNDGLSADRPSVVDREKEEAWAVAVRPPELRVLMLVDAESGRALYYQHLNGVVPDLAAVKAQCADALGLDPADIVLVKARGDFGSSDAFCDEPSNEDSCGCDGCSSFRECMTSEMVSEVFNTMKDRMRVTPYVLDSESALEGKCFIEFLAISIYMLIEHVVSLRRGEEALKSGDAVHDIINELLILRRIILEGEPEVFTEGSRRQQEILRLFCLGMPWQD